MRRSDGFTLIELLVTVAIVLILSAIAIPAMSQYRARAYDGVAISDLRNAVVAFESAISSGAPPPPSAAALQAYGYRRSDGISYPRYQVTNVGGVAELHIHTKHANSARSWHTRYPTDGGRVEIR